jgi:hypothetical protein
MSLPCASKSKYKVCTEEKISASLCPGKIIDGEPYFTCDRDEKVGVIDYSSNSATLDYPLGLRADYKIDSDGVTVTVSGEGQILHLLPAFSFDGEKETKITLQDKTLEIEYEGHVCRFTTDGIIRDLGKTAYNRNGYYRLFYADNQDSLTIKIELL